MGVFLRWGIFGIIAVAALVYAYNALGHLGDRRKQSTTAVVAPVASETMDTPGAPASTDMPRAQAAADARPAASDAITGPTDDIPERCLLDLDIARRAAESRSIGAPLDRLLRIQEIAWQKDEKLRAHLTDVATRWYAEPGPVDPQRLRRDVVAACVAAIR
jgi:hypothetical protein